MSSEVLFDLADIFLSELIEFKVGLVAEVRIDCDAEFSDLTLRLNTIRVRCWNCNKCLGYDSRGHDRGELRWATICLLSAMH